MPYMRRYSGRDSGSSGSSLIGFLVGCLAGISFGVALGVLMAPHRGDITRRKLARRAGETRDQVVEKVEDLMVHRSEEEEADADEAASH
jgi:gas vesicle protein